MKIQFARQLLLDWDFKFTKESAAASIFSAWEFQISYYLHEKKIPSPKLRIAISFGATSLSFVFKMIKNWADAMRNSNTSTEEEFCALNEIPGKNCLNFMTYTLVQALEDVESRLGPFNPQKNNWRYGSLATVKISHQPFSATPLRSFFEIKLEG